MDEATRQIAEDICTLNRWGTPERIRKNLGRDLTESEIKELMPVLELYAPYRAWIQIWQEQIKDVKPA